MLGLVTNKLWHDFVTVQIQNFRHIRQLFVNIFLKFLKLQVGHVMRAAGHKVTRGSVVRQYCFISSGNARIFPAWRKKRHNRLRQASNRIQFSI